MLLEMDYLFDGVWRQMMSEIRPGYTKLKSTILRRISSESLALNQA